MKFDAHQYQFILNHYKNTLLTPTTHVVDLGCSNDLFATMAHNGGLIGEYEGFSFHNGDFIKSANENFRKHSQDASIALSTFTDIIIDYPWDLTFLGDSSRNHVLTCFDVMRESHDDLIYVQAIPRDIKFLFTYECKDISYSLHDFSRSIGIRNIHAMPGIKDTFLLDGVIL